MAGNASLAYSRQIAGQLQALDAKLELKEKLAGLEKEGCGWLEPHGLEPNPLFFLQVAVFFPC